MKPNIEKAVELLKELYETENGGVGGYGHIVFDDGNVEMPHVISCLKSALLNDWSDDMPEECRQASIKALEHFLYLTEDERNLAISIYHRGESTPQEDDSDDSYEEPDQN